MSSSQNLSRVLECYETQKQKHLEDLKELARIPSISFDGFDPVHVQRSAEATAALFKKTKIENIQILKLSPEVHPYVYGDWLHAPGKPTLLLYAHHDVQPPGREEFWNTAPFEPTVRGERLFGRGTADDKAGIVVHTATISSFLESVGTLPLNIKLIIEGEEECGSSHLSEFLTKYQSLLKADAMVLTDTQNYDVGFPALTVSLRGLVSFRVELTAMQSPKHSGMWGGPVPDPAIALCKMLGSLTDTEGRLNIPGIWDEVRPLTAIEEKQYASLPFRLTDFRNQVGLGRDVRLLPARDGIIKPLVQTWREPSIAINAIEASSRKNVSNVINNTVWTRFGIRIVPDMDPDRTIERVVNHLKKITPWGLELKIMPEDGCKAWGTQAEGPAFAAMMQALEKGYDKKPVLMGCGGSIPFVEPMSEKLGKIPALLVGVEDPYTNAHSENESMMIADFEKTIRSMIYFYTLYGGDNLSNNEYPSLKIG